MDRIRASGHARRNQQAGHMAAPDQLCINVTETLAKWEPSTASRAEVRDAGGRSRLPHGRYFTFQMAEVDLVLSLDPFATLEG